MGRRVDRGARLPWDLGGHPLFLTCHLLTVLATSFTVRERYGSWVGGADQGLFSGGVAKDSV